MKATRLRGLAPISCALLAGLALAGDAFAEARLAVHARGGRLRGGERVEILLSGLPSDVEELELYLVPARGARPLRLTPSAESSERCAVRLPNVALLGASLRVRVGDGTRESWAAESEPFALEVSPLLDPSEVAERFGEEWLLASPALPDPADLSRPDSSLNALRDEPALLFAPENVLLAPSAAEPERLEPLPAPRAPEAPRPPRTAAFATPLRR